MKRIIPCIAIMSLLLSGCSSGKLFAAKPDFNSAYTVEAQVKCGGDESRATVTRNSSGDWEFCFTEPEALNGIKLNLSGGQMSAALGELNISAEESPAYTTVPELIADSLDLLPDVKSDKITDNEGILSIETELDSRRVTVTADSSGNLISLKCPYHKLSVYFSNQQTLGAAAESTESDEGSISLE